MTSKTRYQWPTDVLRIGKYYWHLQTNRLFTLVQEDLPRRIVGKRLLLCHFIIVCVCVRPLIWLQRHTKVALVGRWRDIPKPLFLSLSFHMMGYWVRNVLGVRGHKVYVCVCVCVLCCPCWHLCMDTGCVWVTEEGQKSRQQWIPGRVMSSRGTCKYQEHILDMRFFRCQWELQYVHFTLFRPVTRLVNTRFLPPCSLQANFTNVLIWLQICDILL